MQLVFFRLHLVLHACAARFDVTGAAQNFLESKRGLSWVPAASAPGNVAIGWMDLGDAVRETPT